MRKDAPPRSRDARSSLLNVRHGAYWSFRHPKNLLKNRPRAPVWMACLGNCRCIRTVTMTVTMTVQQIISVLSLYWSVGCNRCIPMYRCPCQDFAVEVDPEAKFSDSKSACSTSSTFSTFSTFAHVSSHVSSHVSLVIFQAKQLVLRMPEEASLQAQKVRKVLVERVDMRGQHSLIRKFSAEAQKETRLLRTLQFLCDNYRL